MNVPFFKQLIKGTLTWFPRWRSVGLGSIISLQPARYSYSVWLRHLVQAHELGIKTPFEVVAELGPGYSLGIGMAALLTGTRRYIAFDVEPYAANLENVRILDEMADLLRRREPIPDDREWPEVIPKSAAYDFPHHILTEELLGRSLQTERLEQIRENLQGGTTQGDNEELSLSYVAPWNDPELIRPNSIDLILSQAVLEHVDELENTYRTMHRWLKPGGVMSHAVDFKCHGTAATWNGHWAYSDFTWQLMRGKRPFFLNRAPYATHRNCLDQCGFNLIREIKYPPPAQAGTARVRLARRFRDISDEDLGTAAVFYQAVKT